MSLIDRGEPFIGDSDAKASGVNSEFDKIYNEFNGNIDERNFNFPNIKYS